MISIGKPTILAIDSASNACAAALLIDGDVRRHEWEGMIRGHAKVLMPMISSVVGDYGYHNIDAIAVTIGPGAYTGIRIGLATARGLALASELPIIGVSNFKAVARGVSQKITDKRSILAILETKRADVYVQSFDSDLKPLSKPACIPPEKVVSEFNNLFVVASPVILTGDAVYKVVEALSGENNYEIAVGNGFTDASVVAYEGMERLIEDPTIGKGKMPGPMYLRPPDVSIPKTD